MVEIGCQLFFKPSHKHSDHQKKSLKTGLLPPY